jgi:putative Holliday junction resolvase
MNVCDAHWSWELRCIPTSSAGHIASNTWRVRSDTFPAGPTIACGLPRPARLRILRNGSPQARCRDMSVILPLAEAAVHLAARGALIGLDLGTKTIGVAASDPDRKLATAVETIARKTFTADAKRIIGLAAERAAVGIVLGLPINMDGSEGPRAQSTRAFARNLAKLTELPIALWDERLSTAAVERELIAADVSRKKRAAVIDQHAAAFILQGALDRLARM